MDKRYWNGDANEYREGEVIERNGSLAYVEDADTGERTWVDTRDIHENEES